MSEDSCFLLDRVRRTGIVDHRKQGYSVLPCELKEELYRTTYLLHIVILIIKRYCCVPHLLSSSFYLPCKFKYDEILSFVAQEGGIWSTGAGLQGFCFIEGLLTLVSSGVTIQHVQMFSFVTHSLHLNWYTLSVPLDSKMKHCGFLLCIVIVFSFY